MPSHNLRLSRLLLRSCIPAVMSVIAAFMRQMANVHSSSSKPTTLFISSDSRRCSLIKKRKGAE